VTHFNPLLTPFHRNFTSEFTCYMCDNFVSRAPFIFRYQYLQSRYRNRREAWGWGWLFEWSL